jgi:hypothetical protein
VMAEVRLFLQSLFDFHRNLGVILTGRA